MCFGLVIDLVTLQTSSENATITSVTITIDHYSYNLNASGTTVKNLISNDRYELNQTVNIVLCRGAFSQSPYGAVTIIRGN